MPSPRHLLGKTVVPDLFVGDLRGKLPEISSYLGIVALGLLTWAAWRRVAFPRRSYWWSVFALMIVLSWGSRQELFGAKPSLPAGWIYGMFPPFHLIRVPARFNLFAAAVAVVPVAAGLRRLSSGGRFAVVRLGLLVLLTGITLADLAMIPFPSAPIPPPPGVYSEIRLNLPKSTILDAPLFDSTQGQTFSSLWGYWQQIHGLRTSAGYPGLTNTRFDAEIVAPSVFSADRLRPHSGPDSFGVDGLHASRDRAWLELTSHGFDQVVFHFDTGLYMRYPAWFDDLPTPVARFIRAHSWDGIVMPTDGDSSPAVSLDRSQLGSPGHLTWMSDRGWREVRPAAMAQVDRYAALPIAQIEVYQPISGNVVLELRQVEAFVHPRRVRLVEDSRELARWQIEPGSRQDLRSPSLNLAAGRHTWTLSSDGADQPVRSADRLDDAATPFSFRLSGVRISAVEPGSLSVKD